MKSMHVSTWHDTHVIYIICKKHLNVYLKKKFSCFHLFKIFPILHIFHLGIFFSWLFTFEFSLNFSPKI